MKRRFGDKPRGTGSRKRNAAHIKMGPAIHAAIIKSWEISVKNGLIARSTCFTALHPPLHKTILQPLFYIKDMWE